MIRRFYILPLTPDATDAEVDAFLRALRDADRYIPGVVNSSADIDFESRTVIWENAFVDEESYTGPYMVHPYHLCILDNSFMSDSPERITYDSFSVRYQLPEALPSLDRGIRRVVLLKLSEGADTSAIEALAGSATGMATSVFRPDDVEWVSAKGRAWTHVWEQGFTDRTGLERYLRTRDGIAGSRLEGFKRLGVQIEALKILTCEFEVKPEGAQSSAESAEESPVLYTITARTAIEDADTYIDLLERCYDPSVAAGGGTLLHRWRTVEHGYDVAEVQSTWQLDSVAAYHAMRMQMATDPGWNMFVRDGVPLVKGGTRRFYRAIT